MNTFQLAEDFRAAFADDAAFSGDAQLHGQNSGDFTAPCEIFSATETALSQSGKAARFVLTVEVHSPSCLVEGQPAPEIAHAARVLAVRSMLHDEARKAALLARLLGLGRWQTLGWDAAGEECGHDGMRFQTPVRLNGTVVEI